MTSGQTNLALFVQLFWLVVSAFLAVVLTVWPISFFLKGEYILPKGGKGRACLIEEHRNGFVHNQSQTVNMMSLSFNLLGLVILLYLRNTVKRFISGICPRGRMSCMGKYRRNVLTLDTTYLYLMAGMFYRVASPVLAHYGRQISPAVHFWLWNTTAGLWGEGLYLLLPWLLTVPESTNRAVTVSNFYVRKPAVLPRPENGKSWGETLTSLSRVIHVEECRENEPSSRLDPLSQMSVGKPALQPLYSNMTQVNECYKYRYIYNRFHTLK